jgi:hypothetical protein
MKNLRTLIFLFLIGLINSNCMEAQEKMRTISQNGMKISWTYKNDRIFFEMEAQTDGWVAIGFNDQEGMAGTYLIMGNVINGKASVVEHYTISAGNYKKFSDLGANNSVKDVQGSENKQHTKLQFSLPIKSSTQYSKDLSHEKEYIFLLAFSQEDDFQHHSIMRTSEEIIL